MLCDCVYCVRKNWIPRWQAQEHRMRWEMAPLPEVGQSSRGAGGYDSDEVRFKFLIKNIYFFKKYCRLIFKDFLHELIV